MSNIKSALSVLTEDSNSVPLDSILGKALLSSKLQGRKRGKNNVLYNGVEGELFAKAINSNDIDKRGVDYIFVTPGKEISLGSTLKTGKIKVLKDSDLYKVLVQKPATKEDDGYGYGYGQKKYQGD